MSKLSCKNMPSDAYEKIQAVLTCHKHEQLCIANIFKWSFKTTPRAAVNDQKHCPCYFSVTFIEEMTDLPYKTTAFSLFSYFSRREVLTLLLYVS